MIEVIKALIEKEGKYLLLKRKPDSRFFPSKWDFAGGKLEPGEDIKDCVMREVLEETCMRIEPGEVINEIEHEEHGKQIHFRIFSVNSFHGEIGLSKDHTEYKWISKEEMSSLDLALVVKKHFNQP